MKIYVPLDAAARSAWAPIRPPGYRGRGNIAAVAVELVRNGSRGLLWLEPLVEVDVAGARMAYGPSSPDDVPRAVRRGFHPPANRMRWATAPTEEIPYFKRQERLTFARVGLTDPR